MSEHRKNIIIGSKAGAGVYQNIINTFPKHDIYIEPFIGSGAIIKKKLSAEYDFGMDISQKTVNEHKDAKGYSVNWLDGIQFLKSSKPLINWIHHHSKKILIYCDPPYPIETRRSQAKIYEYEIGKYGHRELIKTLIELSCYCVISSYRNNMYDQMLLQSGWNHLQFTTATRQGKAIETIYYNFSKNIIKHEYSYAGKNYRERAAIKSRVENKVKNYNLMPMDDRRAFIEKINRAGIYTITENVEI